MSDLRRHDTRFRTAGGIARLTLARPEIRNALTGRRVLDEIALAFSEAEADPAVTVLVIDAEGPAFSAGGNVKDMAARAGMFAGDPEEIAEEYRRSIQSLTKLLASTDLVTIAAVDGPAVGAGFDLVLGCDLRIGSTSARFAHTFVDLGILPGDGGAWLLPRVVGWQRAAELAFTARTIDAGEAVDYGVLLEVVEPSLLASRVEELSSLIASKPAHSVRLTKRLLRNARTMPLDGFLDLTAAMQAIAHSTDAHMTAVNEYIRRLADR
ncbi:MAG TPA: enoyl-CoA hydratase-related protein [Acidimicrobiia bacterium]|nr:enoyl-CoA hydratase-related protein [Acidimicrobiia bacterium]